MGRLQQLHRRPKRPLRCNHGAARCAAHTIAHHSLRQLLFHELPHPAAATPRLYASRYRRRAGQRVPHRSGRVAHHCALVRTIAVSGYHLERNGPRRSGGGAAVLARGEAAEHAHRRREPLQRWYVPRGALCSWKRVYLRFTCASYSKYPTCSFTLVPATRLRLRALHGGGARVHHRSLHAQRLPLRTATSIWRVHLRGIGGTYTHVQQSLYECDLPYSHSGGYFG